MMIERHPDTEPVPIGADEIASRDNSSGNQGSE
jgi:hypothetical protein